MPLAPQTYSALKQGQAAKEWLSKALELEACNYDDECAAAEAKRLLASM